MKKYLYIFFFTIASGLTMATIQAADKTTVDSDADKEIADEIEQILQVMRLSSELEALESDLEEVTLKKLVYEGKSTDEIKKMLEEIGKALFKKEGELPPDLESFLDTTREEAADTSKPAHNLEKITERLDAANKKTLQTLKDIDKEPQKYEKLPDNIKSLYISILTCLKLQEPLELDSAKDLLNKVKEDLATKSLPF